MSAPQDSPLHLPPRWAWKDPNRWLKPLEENEKIPLPVDDRGFVKTHEAVETVKDLFVDDYIWRHDSENFETRPDDHHFYYFEEDYKRYSQQLAAVDDPRASVPIEFRGNPNNIGTMFRHAHNVFHHLSLRPDMPELDAMDEYLDRYKIAKQIFTRLLLASEETLEVQRLKIKRRDNVRRRPETVKDGVDTAGQQYFQSEFESNFGSYQKALQEFMSVDNPDIIMLRGQLKLERPTPHQIVRIGKIATKRAVDFRPLLVAA